MREVRRVAEDAGAFLTVAQMDLVVADIALATFDHDSLPGGGAALRRGQPPIRAGEPARWRCSGLPGRMRSAAAKRRWRLC